MVSTTYRSLSIMMIVGLFTLTLTPLFEINHQSLNEISPDTVNENKTEEWIIKWEGTVPKEMLDQIMILEIDQSIQVMRVKLKENISKSKWLNQWKNHPKIKYIYPDHIYQISERPNDGFYKQQYYLKQIHAESGWDEISSSHVTIAILDTGVDLTHPDLVLNLVDGINLIDKDKLPQDDNGHGTNVAGIVAGVADNGIGVAGVTWSGKIMPIKVLDKNGIADNSFFVGQGIRYAVDHGAKIVLLALGDSVFTPFLDEAAKYAEEKGVLLVAASGNKGNRLNYPAAFPNVLSVGAVDENDQYEEYSNFDQQLDVVAPGAEIFTTKLGGEYTINSGTSMAAPQVAGLAALIMEKYPALTPKEVADLIKFTADDIGDPGWDEKTGYGRINVAKALSIDLDILQDGYERNETWHTAHIFPLGDTFHAMLADEKDVDWYKLQLAYDGKVQITLMLDQTLEHDIELEIIPSDQVIDTFLVPVPDLVGSDEESENPTGKEASTEKENRYMVKKEKTVTLDLKKGTSYIKVAHPSEAKKIEGAIHYQLKNSFTIYQDRFEPNDYPWQAYYINDMTGTITGTFHKEYDEDWYRIHLNKSGTLNVSVSVNTLRLDPVLWLQPLGSTEEEFDNNGSGHQEFGFISVSPGDYLIRVSDYNGYPMEGEYELRFGFTSNDGDIHEPNDISTEATLISFYKTIEGVISNEYDYDWFTFQLEESTYIVLDFLSDKNAIVSLMGQNYQSLWMAEGNDLSNQGMLEKGSYFIRIYSPNMNNKYRIHLEEIELIGNFIDVKDHWATQTIVKLYNEGLIEGYPDYTFRPNESITREEVIEILNNDLKQSQAAYKDPLSSRPDEPVKRSEVIVMLMRAYEIPMIEKDHSPFKDVDKNQFAYQEIISFNEYGLITGYEDQTFRPDDSVTRAEFAALLNRVRNLTTNLYQNNGV